MLNFERAKLILVVDQLEELVTGAAPEADRLLLARFFSALARGGEVWTVATLRDDFWPQIAKIAGFADIADGEGRLDVASPSPAEIVEIIRRPILAAGLGFESDPTTGLGLDAMLTQEAANEPGVLPLLSFLLDGLYAADIAAAGGSNLTFASYEALGGLKGAIAKRAEDTVGALPPEAREALPRVLRALTAPGGDAAVMVARPAPLAAFFPGQAARRVVDALLEQRLLVASNEHGEATVRVAHEALLSQWARARQQLVLDRRDLETRALIERQMSLWNAASKREKHMRLLQDPDLAAARDLALRWGDDLDEALRDFIAASARSAERAKIWRWSVAAAIIVVLSVLTAASLGALAIAQGQRDDALIAQSRSLVRDSRAAVERGDGSRAVALALAALPGDLGHPDRPFLRDAANALADAYVNRREIAELDKGDGDLDGIVFSPNGRWVVVGSESGTARLWNVDAPAISIALKASGARLYGAVFSPDGARVATASADGSARLYSVATGASLGRAMIYDSDVVSLAFSPDGSRLVTGELTGVARLWNGETGAPVGELMPCGDDSAPTVLFSPDGQSILTCVGNRRRARVGRGNPKTRKQSQRSRRNRRDRRLFSQWRDGPRRRRPGRGAAVGGENRQTAAQADGPQQPYRHGRLLARQRQGRDRVGRQFRPHLEHGDRLA